MASLKVTEFNSSDFLLKYFPPDIVIKMELTVFFVFSKISNIAECSESIGKILTLFFFASLQIYHPANTNDSLLANPKDILFSIANKDILRPSNPEMALIIKSGLVFFIIS